MREAMLTIPILCLRAYIVCPVTLHNYSLPMTTRQVKGVNLILFHKKERPKQIQIHISFIIKELLLFCKQKHSNSTKKFSANFTFWLTRYLFYFLNVVLSDLFFYSYEAQFIQDLFKVNENNLARPFNFTFCYIDDALSLNNCKFGDQVDRIYHIEFEIKDTTDTARYVPCFALLLEIDSEDKPLR